MKLSLYTKNQKSKALHSLQHAKSWRLFLFEKNQKGMALIMVLSTIIFIILLIQETVFETQIEYRSAVAELNSLRAYYSAKAGMEVNLLRVNTYVKLHKQHGNKIEPFRSYVDLIWKIPFVWPPPASKHMDSISAGELSKLTEDSFMQSAHFMATIEPENSRIDINDLASPIPSLRKWTFQVLYRLIYHLQTNDKKLASVMDPSDISEILHNIKDWADPDTHRKGNSSDSESQLYDRVGYPPNRSFFTIEELNQVAGMSDTLYKALEPFITVYGEKGLNINTAPVELLQALHDEFPKELAEGIAKLTNNPADPFLFTKKEDFSKFLKAEGMEGLEQALFPKNPQRQPKNEESISYIQFSAPHNFRINSTGLAGNSQKTLTATYFHTPAFTTRFKKLMKEEKEREKKRILAQSQIHQSPPPGSQPPQRPQNQPTGDKSTPTFDRNSSPTIIYWKESF